MQIAAEKTEKPLLICQNVDEDIKEMAIPYIEEREYSIIAEVGQGICLPDKEKYWVKIQIAEFEMKSDKAVFQENTYNRWNQRLKQQTVKWPY